VRKRERDQTLILFVRFVRIDSEEPPVKKRRGIATTLVDGVVSGASLLISD